MSMTEPDPVIEPRFTRRLPLRSLAVAASVVVGAFAALFLAAQIYFYHDIPRIPPTPELWTVKRDTSVTLLDRNGELLAVRGPFYAEAVEVGELPSHLLQAFLATEDRRFYSHDGVDRRAMLRAFFANWQAGRVTQGGSTITQQLVKTLFLTSDRNMRRKLQEIRLARQLEKQLTKPEIFTLYLNRVYLGGRAYGVEAAAQRYFNKSAREVTLAEAALLAGLPKAPDRLDPTRNLQAARERARIVLASMEAEDFISEAQRAGAEANPAALTPLPAADEEAQGAVGYIFDAAMVEAERALPRPVPDLVITTTIEKSKQTAAETAVAEILEAYSDELNARQAALVSLDRDGGVVAMVGGRNYSESRFDRVISARRQPGSAFKPLVYAAALEAGVQPSDIYIDEPIRIGNWSPANYTGEYLGSITLREAMLRSVNTVAARIAEQVGPGNVAVLARRFGVPRELEPFPSIALGVEEVSLWELAGAYSVFLNDGARREPHLIGQLTDSRGAVLYARPTLEDDVVFNPESAKVMRGMLRAVVTDPNGTGSAAAVSGVDVAGKTGTSQEWKDAWFVGFSSMLTTGVWVGNDDNTPMDEVTGGGMPAVIWSRYMGAAHGDGEAQALDVPVLRARSPRDQELADFYTGLSARFDRLLTGGT